MIYLLHLRYTCYTYDISASYAIYQLLHHISLSNTFLSTFVNMDREQLIIALRKIIFSGSTEWIVNGIIEYITDECHNHGNIDTLHNIIMRKGDLYSLRKDREDIQSLFKSMRISNGILKIIDTYVYKQLSKEDQMYICGYNCKVLTIQIESSEDLHNQLRSYTTSTNIISEYNANWYRLPLLKIVFKPTTKMATVPSEIYNLNNIISLTLILEDRTILYETNVKNLNVLSINVESSNYSLDILNSFPNTLLLNIQNIIWYELDSFSLPELLVFRVMIIEPSYTSYYMDDVQERFPKLLYIESNGGLCPFNGLGDYIFKEVQLRHIFLSDPMFIYNISFYHEFIKDNMYKSTPCQLTIFLDSRDKRNMMVFNLVKDINYIYPVTV